MAIVTGTPGWTMPAQLATEPQTCILCGELSIEVRHELIRWRTGTPFGSGPRCGDRDACWERAMAIGEDWLVADQRPMRRVADEPTNHAETIPVAAQPEVEELDFGTAPEDAE